MIRRLAALLFVGVLSFGVVSTAIAQEKAPGSGLRISPTRTELSLDRGKTAEIKISLKNVSGGDIVAKAAINDFEADGEQGEPKIIVDRPGQRSGTSIAPLLSGVKDVPLKKDESKEIKVGVAIPGNASSGAYYGVIRYLAVPAAAATNETESGKVSLTASVATLVLIEVPGNITQQIQLTNIFVYQGDNEKSKSFFTSPPTRTGIRIKNTGNSFSKPFGRVIVTNSFTGKEVYSYEMNNTTPRNNVLPNTARVFTDDIKNVNKPGRYTITAGISHGSGGEVLTKKTSFWYVPLWMVIVLAVLLILIILGLFLLFRKIRGSRRNFRR